MSIVIKEKEISWEEHPHVSDVKIKTFLTKRDHEADMTTLLVNIPKGINVPEHIHQKEDDNLYILSGKGKMWIESIGEIDLHQGVFIRVYKGVKHKIYDVIEDITALDVFIPPSV